MKQAKLGICLVLLLAFLIGSPARIAFAEVSCTVSTDRSSYLVGQTLVVSGMVSPIASGQDVAIVVNGPALDLRSLDEVHPSSNGSYFSRLMTFRADDPLGTWTVKATYQGVQAVATFEYLGAPKASSISCSVSSNNITIGNSVAISGLINPSRSNVSVTLSYNSNGSANTIVTVVSSSDGSYSYSWKPASAGNYQMTASWQGDSLYTGATSDSVSVVVNKISTSISCKSSSSDITQGDNITISGAISPPVSGKNVTLTYTKPDGNTTVTRVALTGADGSYSDSYMPDTSGSWSFKASWGGDSEHQAAATGSASFNVKSRGCIIATATYGSELSPEVQFLRDFRDNTVLSTYAGSNFMTVFNGFYYSFSPTVASVISVNDPLRGIMKVLLYPLIGILHLSSAVFSLFSFDPELGVVTAGLVASSLIAAVYVMPWVLIFGYVRKFKPSMKVVSVTALVWIGSVLAMFLAEVTVSSQLMIASTGVFVIVTMCLTTLGAVRALLKHHIS